MPGKSQYYSDCVLNVLAGTAINGVSPYLALFSAAPANNASAGTELNGNGYARQPITFSTPAPDGTGNVQIISNTNNILLGPAAADWLPAVAFGIFDAQTNGNLLYWSTLAVTKTIQQGDFGQFAPGSLVVEED
jgi:hypothetical protein